MELHHYTTRLHHAGIERRQNVTAKAAAIAGKQLFDEKNNTPASDDDAVQ
jgi:hypothetical protein